MKLKEVNEKYSKEIYLNVLKAIIFIAYFLVLNLAYENIATNTFELGIKILTMIFLFISIYIIEKAYKKDDGNLAIQGIEVLVLSTYTLTSEHITNKFDFDFKKYSLVASYIFAIYFILKSIVVYTKGRKEVAQNLSDIRKIVKKEEPTKKEAVKKSEVKNEENIEKSKKTNEDKIDEKLENKKEKSEKVNIANNKKSNKNPKTNKTKNNSSEKEQKIKTTPKTKNKTEQKKTNKKQTKTEKKNEEVKEND